MAKEIFPSKEINYNPHYIYCVGQNTCLEKPVSLIKMVIMNISTKKIMTCK